MVSVLEPSSLMILLMGTVVYFSLYATALKIILKRKREKKTKRKNEFYITLANGLKTGSIKTINDVVNIYKGTSGLSSEDLSYRYGLSKQLREFLVLVISKKKSIDKPLTEREIRSWKEKISKFIQENDKTSPYADLPESERNNLTDILKFLETKDYDSVKRKTLELASMIQARSDDLNRVRNINKWTVPLSVVGLLLTIIFGLLTLY